MGFILEGINYTADEASNSSVYGYNEGIIVSYQFEANRCVSFVMDGLGGTDSIVFFDTDYSRFTLENCHDLFKTFHDLDIMAECSYDLAIDGELTVENLRIALNPKAPKRA